MADQIVIRDKAAFQATADEIAQIAAGLDEKIKGADTVLSAAEAAAGAGVVNGEPGTSGAAVAAAYTGTLSALKGAIGDLASAARSSQSSVQTVVTELNNLLAGMNTIDEAGAAGVGKS